MKTLNTKIGQNFEFELLKYDENNLTKVLLKDEDGNSEGIWITVSPETNELLNKDTHGDYFIAMLCNNALAFNFPSWGLHILCRTNGDMRPVAYTDWVDYDNEENRIYTESVTNV